MFITKEELKNLKNDIYNLQQEVGKHVYVKYKHGEPSAYENGYSQFPYLFGSLAELNKYIKVGEAVQLIINYLNLEYECGITSGSKFVKRGGGGDDIVAAKKKVPVVKKGKKGCM